MTHAMQKIAVDSVAKDYWVAYYGSYGESWTKEIPKRVVAELKRLDNQAGKTAKTASKTASTPQIRPLATVITDVGVSLEGIAKYSDGCNRMFIAEFDHEGDVLSFDAVSC